MPEMACRKFSVKSIDSQALGSHALGMLHHTTTQTPKEGTMTKQETPNPSLLDRIREFNQAAAAKYLEQRKRFTAELEKAASRDPR